GTFDPSTQMITLYVNGTAVASTVLANVNVPSIFAGTAPLRIGATNLSGPLTRFFAGLIDEPAVYSRALTAAEVATIYAGGGASKGQSVVAGNRIGTNAAGTAALGTNNIGVQIYGGSSGNLIGGTTAADRNLISGHSNYGLSIHDANTRGNLVEGNYIGTDVTGKVAVAKGTGIRIDGAAQNSVVGGTAAG